MFCRITQTQSSTSAPVYFHVPLASDNLPKSVHEALSRHARVYTMAEIDGLYPEPLLRELNYIVPKSFDMNATLPAFGNLSPEHQNLAIAASTNERYITSLTQIIAWPSLQQDSATIMDMVAQQCFVEDPTSSHRHAHASWLRAVQDNRYPARHALYPLIGIEDENIDLALQNWPNLPTDVRNFLHWNDQSLFANIKRHRVYVFADPKEQDAIASKLGQHGVSLTAQLEMATVHISSYEPAPAAEAMQHARANNQPCYLVSTPDDKRLAEIQRLETAYAVMTQLRERYEDDIVEHSIADVMVLLNAIIPHYPPTTHTALTLP